MQPSTEQPHFIVEEGAPPGTQEAFNSLVTFVAERPDVVLAIFNTAGDTPTEIHERAGRLGADDESYAARGIRLLSDILQEEFDQEVELPGADAAMRRLIEGRSPKLSYEERRVRRVGFFVGILANAAKTRDGAASEAA